MRVRNIILLIIVATLCLFLVGCATLFSTQNGSLPEVDSIIGKPSVVKEADIIDYDFLDVDSISSKSLKVKEADIIDYDFLDADSTKEESIDAEQVFETLIYGRYSKDSPAFVPLDYNVTRKDALIYAKSSALVGDRTNEYKMLSYLGYDIDEDVLAKADNYSEAKILIRDGKYIEAFRLLCKDSDYHDSKKLAEKMIENKLVVFKVGDVGPAGGYVFYDKGSYSDGWRYLEVAPEDLEERYSWDLYYPNQMVETSTVIGAGNTNTERIVERARKDAWMETGAARACVDYVYNGFEDWFLPSIDELNLIIEILFDKGLGNPKNYYGSAYWSSSAYSSGGYPRPWSERYTNGWQKSDYLPDWSGLVRPVRAF